MSNLARKSTTKAATATPSGPVVAQPNLRWSEFLEEAASLLGSMRDAMKWAREPIPSLNDLTPIQLLETDEGVASLKDYMNQIRYGVYI